MIFRILNTEGGQGVRDSYAIAEKWSLEEKFMLDVYIKALNLGYFEVTEAFKGLADEHVWKRPHPALLSIGELAGHIAYWEAVRYAGSGENGASARDLSDCKVSSPLLDPQFGYYTTAIDKTPTNVHLGLSAQQVSSELARIHLESMEHLKALNPDLDSAPPYWSTQSNYRELLTYVAFHIAYHTGQMYSVRHLLGEATPDN